LEFAATHHYTSKIKLLGIPDEFIEQGSIDELQQYSGISVDSLEIIFSSY
jgi:1-deoxy-D-xylulose-5-phosphate synthase